MASKLKKQTTQPDLLAALKEAGYSIARFQRRGGTLVVHLKPAALKGKDGNFRALETCRAASLQARCNVFQALPENILILSVLLPESTATNNQQPSNDHA